MKHQATELGAARQDGGPGSGLDAACYRALLDRGADVTVLVDPDGIVRWVSPAATRILGHPREQLIGSLNFDLVHPADRDVVATAYGTVLAEGGDAGPIEYRLRDGRGRWRRVETLLTNMVADPRVGAVVLSVRDVTDRVGVASGRRESDDRYRGLLEHSPDGVFVVDEDIRIVYASSMALRLLGAPSPGAVFGRTIADFVPSADADAMHRMLRSALRNDVAPLRGERTLVRFDGRRVDVALSCASVFHAGRKALQLVVRDITRQKSARRQADQRMHELEQYAVELREVNRELESFGAIAFHDLQQPMQAVFGYLSMIEDGRATSDEQIVEWSGSALRSLRRMHGMLESLVDRSKADSNDIQLAMVDSAALVAEIVDDLSPTLSAVDGSVEVDPLPDFVADPAQVGELFQNLIANALKFVTPGLKPVIRVSAMRDGAQWHFTVEDNGIGIPEASLTEVFEPFRRLSSNNHYAGSGLGLYTCRRIVGRHGGAIWAERREPTGTRICFTLPDHKLPED